MNLCVRGAEGKIGLIPATAGDKLSEAIWLSGLVVPAPLCGGLSLCGRCRVRYHNDPPSPVDQDKRKFSAAELEAGWRLACHHKVPLGECLNLDAPGVVYPKTNKNIRKASRKCALGIDFGTTTVQWRAIDPGVSQEVLLEGSLPNPQAGAGAEVISRLAYANVDNGSVKLSELSMGAIAAILDDLLVEGLEPDWTCIAANSAMTEILLGLDSSALMQAPYRLSYSGGETLELRLSERGQTLRIILPPLPGPFIGGDVAAGLLTLREQKRPLLLADMGTNVEFALWTEEEGLYFASAPLGPAMEGIGPECGQPAGADVITRFNLSPHGIGIEGGKMKTGGISATGYLSLLALLFQNGILTESGQFSGTASTPLAAKIITHLEGDRLHLPGSLYLGLADIELLLKAKAAFRVALDLILSAAGISANLLEAIYLGGALGEHSNIDDLVTLGFIPATLRRKSVICGNSSLEGACILALDPALLDELRKLCASATILNLAEDKEFNEQYLSAMRWGENEAIA